MKFLDMFIEDCKFYDKKNIELKTILKHVKIKGKTILDIGTGIGRLAFPLSKYAKEVVALDKDKRFKEYFKRNKKKNVKFVNKRAEEYLKNGKKFDIILLLWPFFNFNFLRLVKNVMNKDSLFIFITCDNNSDYESLVDKLKIVRNGYFNEDIEKKNKFMNLISKRFKRLIKRKIKTEYVYPNEKIAFMAIKNSIKLFFYLKLNEKASKKLEKIIKNHKKGKKIVFGERIYFYILKKLD